MKKFLGVLAALVLSQAMVAAETMDLGQLLTQAENNNPNVVQLKQQINMLKSQGDALYGIYDTHLNMTAGLNFQKNQVTGIEAEKMTMLSGSLGWNKKMENGISLGLSADTNFQNTTYTGALAAFGLPSDLATSKIGANFSMPLSQNSGGILDRLMIESTLNQINQQKISLEQKLRDERYNVYQAYLQAQLTMRLIKLRQETLERNKEYEVIAKRKRQTGYIQDAEYAQAQLAVISAEKDFLESREQYRNTLLNLKRTCGLDPDFALEVKEDSVDILPQPENYNALQQKLIASDLMQQSLSLNVLISLQKIDAAENALQAQWNLQSSLALVGKKADPLGSIGEIAGFYPTFFVGIQSDLAGATTKEKTDAELADLNKKIAENNLDYYQNQLRHRFKSAFDQYQFSKKMIGLNEKLLAKYRDYIKSLQRDYSLGKVDGFQLNQAENAYVLAELGSIQNMSQMVLHLLNVQYLLGEI
jgi:outer membrane protein TolC